MLCSLCVFVLLIVLLTNRRINILTNRLHPTLPALSFSLVRCYGIETHSRSCLTHCRFAAQLDRREVQMDREELANDESYRSATCPMLLFSSCIRSSTRSKCPSPILAPLRPFTRLPSNSSLSTFLPQDTKRYLFIALSSIRNCH